ncbi:MAG: hypothetical protein QOG67_2653 [Verrucomicrobiota bacterium]
MKVLFQVIENVFEAEQVLRRRLAESFMSSQHRLRLFFFLFAGMIGLPIGSERSALGRGITICLDTEDLIQAEAIEQITAARPAMHDVEMPLTELFQTERYSGHGSHESRIHHGAVLEINDEFPVTAAHHFLGKLLQVPAVQETSLPLYPDPDHWAIHSD